MLHFNNHKMLLSQSHAAAGTTVVSFGLCIIACCIVSALFINRDLSESSTLDPYDCHALLTKGRWFRDAPGPQTPTEGGRWQPAGCMLHEYTQHDIEKCLKHSAIVFVGDSTVRRLFWTMINLINVSVAQDMESTAQKHSDAAFQHENMKLQFLWDPYLNASFERTWRGLDLHTESPWNETLSVVVIVSSGLWHAKYMEDQYLSIYKSQVRSLTDVLSYAPRTVTKGATFPPAYRSQLNHTPIFLPVIHPDVRRSDQTHLKTFTPERLDPMNEFLEYEASNGRIELFQSFGTMAQNHPAPFQSDGLHLSDHLTLIQANVLFNFLCNSRTVMQKPPFDRTCCNVAPGHHIGGYMTVAFLIILLIAANSKLRCVSARFQAHREEYATNLVVLPLAVVYCFAADRSPLFEKINKPVNLPGFVLLLVSGSICGLASTSRLPAETLPSEKSTIMTLRRKPFLSRQQSDEWKGWMQLLILLYHYFGMSKILWVYQVARLLVASYLFMTGFGHTTYFLQTKDFSIHRIATVLLRLNMLSCVLGYVMLSSYDFYYFSVLCSFWFVVVFCTLGVGFGGDITAAGIVARCLGSTLCVKGFVHIPGVLEELSTALHTLFRIDFHAQEFRFRVGLDLYVVYFGVLVGWLYHKSHDADFYSLLGLYLRGTEWRRWTTDNEGLLYFVLKASCVTVLSGYLLLIGCFSDKYQYNKLHPWISPTFVLAYLTLRNSSNRLRETHSPLFAWLGRCSLETYILQCHIWLAGDAKGLLRLGIFNTSSAGDFFESIIITVFFLWTSYHVSKATSSLTAAALGSKKATTSRGIAIRVMVVSVTLVAINWLLEILPHELSLRWT